MIAKSMQDLVKNSSAIRAMFEEGKKMAAEYGAENVYDFSLGNPNLPAPDCVRESIKDLADHVPPMQLHGYMSNAGYEEVREKIAAGLNDRFVTDFRTRNILMTVGAAGGLNVVLKTLLDPGDEVLVFAPFFGEYRSYVANHQGTLVVVPPDTETYGLNLKAAEGLITEKTKAVIINNPNNPTGIVYPESSIRALADLLESAEKKFASSIYLISDEPYRELAYDGAQVPYLPTYYHNTIVGYSFSKSLSLPGERIGYLVMPDSLDGAEDIIAAASVANRVLGFVNAPSLMQRVIGECLSARVDLEFYDNNRRLLTEGLSACGFTFVKPEGAFYLWLKSPVPDEKEFVAAAKSEHILLVPGSSFAGSGYVRIAYCVSPETIKNSMPAFRRLAQKYGLC